MSEYKTLIFASRNKRVSDRHTLLNRLNVNSSSIKSEKMRKGESLSSVSSISSDNWDCDSIESSDEGWRRSRSIETPNCAGHYTKHKIQTQNNWNHGLCNSCIPSRICKIFLPFRFGNLLFNMVILNATVLFL